MRFRLSDPQAGDLELPDVAALVDALEAALVTPETPVFDAARQSWQPVGHHPEVRAAWRARVPYLPPGAGRPDLPPLPPDDPQAQSELDQRRRAYELVKRGNRVPLADPPPQARGRRAAVLGLAWVALLLVLMGWGLVAFAGGLSRVARSLVRSEVAK